MLKIIYMQESSQQIIEIKDILVNPLSVRYRRISMSGPAVQAVMNVSPQKMRPRQIMLQFPRKEPEEPINIKAIEQDYYKKYKLETGIKSLLKAYDQTRKKSSSEGMNKLGLDIIQVKSFSTNPHAKTGLTYPYKKIHSRKSIYPHSQNRQILSPVRNKAARQQRTGKQQGQDMDFRHWIELTSSLTSFTDKQRKVAEFSPPKQPKRIFKKQSKAEEYLYKRLEGTQKQLKEQQNHIYDKRIKSFLDFLWKNMYAHNIYMNLDLKNDQINARPKKIKAYIALGNNGAMVRGLLKRRFWWTLVDERSSECSFIWTQIKVNEIFQKQKPSPSRKPVFQNQEYWQDFEINSKKHSKIKLPIVKNVASQEHNQKLMHRDEQPLYKKYWLKFQKEKQREFAFKLQNSPKHLQVISPENSSYVVHNHLQYNFYLGNKKALFYNLKEYYSLVGKNVFDYVPLTFHIRKGLKDPEYARFLDYFNKRAKLMQKQAKQEQDQGRTSKTRNIWIVKPGENSNQGRGITVIDEIYELNSILKAGRSRDKEGRDKEGRDKEGRDKEGRDKEGRDKEGGQGCQESQKTYIVQLYIDRPLLYNNRKFDIRHYMLISNFFGVTRAYWYDEGYVRTSSYQFDIHNFAPEIHLTNDAVQKHFPDYGRYEPSNKVSYDEFQRYLDSGGKKYSFKEQILPKMKEMATDSARSVATKISPRNQMNNFEIYGLDFMIDRHFQPWLIEINTNPCLECVCPLLARIIPYMVETAFKLTVDLAFPPPTHYPNTAKHLAPMVGLDKFKFQLIFDSQYQGEQLAKLYNRVRSNFIEKIGEIQDDEEFLDEGKECKLDDYT